MSSRSSGQWVFFLPSNLCISSLPSLTIPLVDTIVTQEKQIVTLVDTLEKTNADFKKSQKELLTWATDAISQLNAKNELLFENLVNAQSKIKNFSFNIQVTRPFFFPSSSRIFFFQGFEDKTEVDDLADRMQVLNKAKPKPPGEKEADPLYFPTEDGAPLKNHLEVSQTAAVKSKYKKASSSSLLEKMIGHTASAAKDDPNSPPKMTAHQRWQFAIRQVIIRGRIAKLGFSLTRTRVTKSSSVLDRLERIEQRLFYLPMEVADKLSQLEASLSRKIVKDLLAIEEKHRESTLKTTETLSSLDGKLDSLTDEMEKLGAGLKELRGELTVAIQTESKKTGELISQLKQLREQDVKLHHLSLRDKFVTLTSAFKTLELGIGRVSKEIDRAMKANEANYKRGTDESAPALLKSDTNLKHLRERFTSLESDLFTLQTYASSLKQEVATVLGEQAGELLSQINDVVTEGFGEVELSVEQIKSQLEKHDEVIAERWGALSSIPKSARDLKTLTEKFENLQGEVDNKVSHNEVHELLRDMMPSSNTLSVDEGADASSVATASPANASAASGSGATDVAPAAAPPPRRGSVSDPQMREKVETLNSQLKDFLQRLETLESARSSATPQGTRTPSSQPFTATPRDSSQLQAVSAMVSQPAMWNQTDFETQVQPLIKDIVSMYLTSWEESQGYYDQDQDYYPEDESFPAENEEGNGNGNEIDGEDAAPKDPMTKLKDFGNIEFPSPRGGVDHSPKPSARVRPSSRTSRVSIREKPKDALDDELTEEDKGASPRPLSQQRRVDATRGLANSASVTDPRRQRKTELLPERKRDGGGADEFSGVSSAEDKVTKRLTTLGESQDMPSSSSQLPPPARSTDAAPPTRKLLPANSRSRDFDEHRPRRPMVDGNEVARLKNDIKELQEKFEKMSRGVMDKETLKTLLNQKADNRTVAAKVDAKVIETIEAAMRDCVAEVGDLKQLREEELNQLKAGVEKKIKSSLRALLQANLDEMKSASASFQSLCLSCGQKSPVRTQGSQASSVPFLPSLNSHSTTGPEVYRAGFRMPVLQPSGLAAPGSLVLGSNFSLLSIDESLLSEGDGASKKGSGNKKQKPTIAAAVPHGPSPTYLEESSCARSLHKKGFPGKKSNRAVVPSLLLTHSLTPRSS
jgi:hypothetical protein